MTHSEKTVFTLGDLRIIRVKYWGFRCNSLSTSWEVKKLDQIVGNYLRLKDAKKAVTTGQHN